LFDQALWAPFVNTLFIVLMATLEGYPIAAPSRVKSRLVPQLTASLKVWPVAQYVNVRLTSRKEIVLEIVLVQRFEIVLEIHVSIVAHTVWATIETWISNTISITTSIYTKRHLWPEESR
jgi:hypothetical protein